VLLKIKGKYDDLILKLVTDVMKIVEKQKLKSLATEKIKNIPDSRLGLLFNPEDRHDTFLQNICGLVMHYTALQPRRSYSS
jgi:hypothetical protein